MKNYYTLGATYRAAHLDPTFDPVPQTAKIFSSTPNDTFFYEYRHFNTMQSVMYKIHNNRITNYDLRLLGLIATFGSVCTTTRSLKKLFCMSGENLGENDVFFKSALKILWANGLINFGHFANTETHTHSYFRIVVLTILGSRLAKTLGIDHRLTPPHTMTPALYKTQAQTTALLTNFLVNQADAIEEFEIRPLMSRQAELGDKAIIRPSLKISLYSGENVYFEVIRRDTFENTDEFLAEKLYRYTLVLHDSLPTVVINGEDESHNYNIYNYLLTHSETHKFPIDNILFTDDVSQLGSGFNSAFYYFDEDGNKLYAEFSASDEDIAV